MAKMPKMSSEKKRSRELARREKAERKERNVREKFLQKNIVKYKKIWIFNYIFFSALFILITVECWKTKSLIVFIISIILFCILFLLHYNARIREDETIMIIYYQDAFLEMKMYTIFGIVISSFLLPAALYLPRIF